MVIARIAGIGAYVPIFEIHSPSLDTMYTVEAETVSAGEHLTMLKDAKATIVAVIYAAPGLVITRKQDTKTEWH